MKKYLVFLSAIAILFLTGCESVQSGHKGVEVSWGGKTNMEVVHPEGLNLGFHWLYDDLIEYDVREKTITEKFEFNDRNNMKTPVALSIDYKLMGSKANAIHSTIGAEQLMAKIMTTLSSAAKQVIPKYSATELNLTKRDSAETEIFQILAAEFPAFFVECSRVRLTDVDIPQAVSALAEQTAVQIGRNELAEKKEAEQTSLAKAKVAEAQGSYDAGILDAKTKQLLSTPAQIELIHAQAKLMWAQKGVSEYGTNNYFGAATGILINR